MPGRNVRARRGTLTCAVAMLGLSASPALAQTGLPSCSTTQWVGSWASSPTSAATGADLYGSVPSLSLGEQSYRMMVAPHLGGSTLRVRLTNRFGTLPTRFAHVTVAKRGQGAAIVPGTSREVRFGGGPAVTAAPGKDVVSDPVSLPFSPSDQLAVTIYVAGPALMPTEHNGAISTQYLTLPGAGDRTADADGSAFTQKGTSWIYLSGIDVQAPGNAASVVALGDSITDGYDATTLGSVPGERAAIDNYVRWPDALQRRLAAAGRPLSAINQGISGNRVVRDQPNFLGLSAVRRVRPDVIDQPGVKSAIIVMGINDLGLYPPFATTQELIAGFSSILRELRAAGIRTFLGTIPPASSAVLDGIVNDPLSDVRRREANAWIRTQRLSDAVIDFDAVLNDPGHPGDLRKEYSSGDGLHPSSLGGEAMAKAVPVDRLAIRSCRTTVRLARRSLSRGRLRLGLGGEAAAATGVTYRLGRRVLLRDGAAPFTRTVSARRLRSARRHTKSRTLTAMVTLRERDPGTVTVSGRLPKAKKAKARRR